MPAAKAKTESKGNKTIESKVHTTDSSIKSLLKKCTICGNPIKQDEESCTYKGKLVHKLCLDAMARQALKDAEDKKSRKETKKKSDPSEIQKIVTVKELKEGLSEEEYKEKQELFDLIRSIQGTKELSAKTYKIIDNLHKMPRRNYSYEQIRKAILWKRNNDDENINWSDFAGFIIYFIDDAIKAWSDAEEANGKNAEIIKNKDIYYERVIKRPVPKSSTNQIDIGCIGEEVLLDVE
jgi:hypothetical protein